MRALAATVLALALVAPMGCEEEKSDAPTPPPPAGLGAGAPAPDFAPIMKRIAADCNTEAKFLSKAKGGTLSDADSAEYWKAHNDRIAALEEIVGMTNNNPRWKGRISAAFDDNTRDAATKMYAAQGKKIPSGVGKNPTPRPDGSKSEDHIIIATFGQWRISVPK